LLERALTLAASDAAVSAAAQALLNMFADFQSIEHTEPCIATIDP
jgi:hypothetical protein